MLRITTAPGPADGVKLLLEGRLAGAWVPELQAAVTNAGCPLPFVHLDLRHVHYVDASGLQLLHALLVQQVVIDTASPFVQELLNTRCP